MRTLLLTLACLCVFATAGVSQPVIVPDTLVVPLLQGDSGESVDQAAFAANPILKAMINVANQYPESYIRVDQWRSNMKWTIAKGNKRVSRALDGGVQEWTETYFKELLAQNGLKESAVDEVVVKDHCCEPTPVVKFRLLWHETKAKETPPAPSQGETIEVNNWYHSTIQYLGGICHLGMGATTTPYNGALTANLEMRFDDLTTVELAFGHSTGLLAKDREVLDPSGTHERKTYDLVYSGRYVRYLPRYPWLGVHLGLIRVENTMEYNLKHIKLYQGVTLGPSIRWRNLSASASLAYGNEKFFREDTRWEFKAFGNVVVYLWR